MIQVSFTEQELNVLNQLIDIAVKAAGLQAAEAAVTLSKKLVDAVNASKLANTPAENKEAA
jgi:hypothetical protein